MFYIWCFQSKSNCQWQAFFYHKALQSWTIALITTAKHCLKCNMIKVAKTLNTVLQNLFVLNTDSYPVVSASSKNCVEGGGNWGRRVSIPIMHSRNSHPRQLIDTETTGYKSVLKPHLILYHAAKVNCLVKWTQTVDKFNNKLMSILLPYMFRKKIPPRSP